jgi:hypothetical protein
MKKDLKDQKKQTLMKDSKTIRQRSICREKKSGFEKALLKKREELMTKGADILKNQEIQALKSIQSKVAQICASIAEEQEKYKSFLTEVELSLLNNLLI